MAKLHQLNVRFDPEQDRLLWSIASDDQSEILLWVTRRYLLLLLQVLDRLADNSGDIAVHGDQETRQAVKSFQRAASRENADFHTEYRPQVKTRPLGDEPLLAKRISYRTAEDGIHHLGVGLVDGRTINLALDQNLLHAVTKILEDGGRQAEWQIETAQAAQAQAEPQQGDNEDALLH